MRLIFLILLLLAGCINETKGEKDIQRTGEAALIWMIVNAR